MNTTGINEIYIMYTSFEEREHLMKNLKEIAYDAIKGKIISCEYAPGNFISEALLMKELDMSRTPIREAFSKLEQEGFLTILNKKGVLVRGLSMTDINQTFEARLVLESFIVRNYASLIDRSALAAIQKETCRLLAAEDTIPADSSVFFQLDDRFHRTLCDACPNVYFRSILTHIYDQSIRIRNMLKNHSRHVESCSEHLKIIAAILDNDTERAEHAVQQHLLHSKDTALHSLSVGNIHFQ